MQLSWNDWVQGALIDQGEPPSDTRCIGFLATVGADAAAHLYGRTLAQHLGRTKELIAAWSSDRNRAYAGWMAGTYCGAFIRDPGAFTEYRKAVRCVIGTRAERYAYLYWLLAGSEVARAIPSHGGWTIPGGPHIEGREIWCTSDELSAVLMIFIATFVEIATVPGCSPRPWLKNVLPYLAKLKEIGVNLHGELEILLGLGCDESALLSNYIEATAKLLSDPADALVKLSTCGAAALFLFEPWILTGFVSAFLGDTQRAALAIDKAQQALGVLSFVWDNRLTRSEWEEIFSLAKELQGGCTKAPRGVNRLLQKVAVARAECYSGMNDLDALSLEARERVTLYITQQLISSARELPRYPGTKRAMTYPPALFPISSALGRADDTILAEIMNAKETAGFLGEDDRRKVHGSWRTAILAENGRIHDWVTKVLPSTSRVLRGFEDALLLGRPAAYISVLGPTSCLAIRKGLHGMSVRLFFPIVVEDGKAGVRVGSSQFRFSSGKCIIVDGLAESEEWNEGCGECIYLVIDLWHPDIAFDERAVLTGVRRQFPSR